MKQIRVGETARDKIEEVIVEINRIDKIIKKQQPKLPKNWYDFRIVETRDGSFTGQIHYNNLSNLERENWEKVGRVKLEKITRKYLESLLGYKIEKYTGDRINAKSKT